LAKTARGADEVKNRTLRLPQAERMVLIMVDGKTTVHSLCARLMTLPQVADTLEKLLGAGLVEQVGYGLLVRPEPRAEARLLPFGGSTAADREATLNSLVRLVRDIAGPEADALTLRLERARNREDFVRAATFCAAIVEGLAGGIQAAAVRQQARVVLQRLYPQ
jgi:hypothetical protein